MLLTLLTIAGITLANPGEAGGVLVKAQAGQRFTVVFDGQPHVVIGGTEDLMLTELKAGPHVVEIRSEDKLVVWGHGTLHLIDGDEVVVTIEEGRSVRVQGRNGVWEHANSKRPQPRKKTSASDTTEK